MKNIRAKMRHKDNPYETWTAHGWTWRVLKHYKSPEAEAKDPYARVFCFVTSPWLTGGEYGDVYVKDIQEAGAVLESPAPKAV